MRGFLLGLAMCFVSAAVFAEERTVVIPEGDAPFKVAKTEIVRLTGQAIAGGNVVAKVEGPAKIETTSVIRQLSDGQPLIGALVKEFDLKPTGKGKVTVTITVTSPIPDVKPEVKKVVFTVE